MPDMSGYDDSNDPNVSQNDSGNRAELEQILGQLQQASQMQAPMPQAPALIRGPLPQVPGGQQMMQGFQNGAGAGVGGIVQGLAQAFMSGANNNPHNRQLQTETDIANQHAMSQWKQEQMVSQEAAQRNQLSALSDAARVGLGMQGQANEQNYRQQDLNLRQQQLQQGRYGQPFPDENGMMYTQDSRTGQVQPVLGSDGQQLGAKGKSWMPIYGNGGEVVGASNGLKSYAVGDPSMPDEAVSITNAAMAGHQQKLQEDDARDKQKFDYQLARQTAAQQNILSRRDLNSVYAFDKADNQWMLTDAGTARQGNMMQYPATAKQIEDDRMMLNRLDDVQQKVVTNYGNALQNPALTQADRGNVAGLIDKFQLRYGDVQIPTDRLNAAMNAENVNALSPAGRDLYYSYVNAREAMSGYARVLTGSGRSSDKNLELNLQVLPDPAASDRDMAARGINQFNQNLNIVRRGLPVMPGMNAMPQQQPSSPVINNNPNPAPPSNAPRNQSQNVSGADVGKALGGIAASHPFLSETARGLVNIPGGAALVQSLHKLVTSSPEK